MSQTAPISSPRPMTSGLTSPVSIQPGRGHLIDELMVMGAFVIMPLGFSLAQPFRLPMTLLLIVWLVMNWRSILPMIQRGAVFFLLPALCLMSALWADNFMAAFRYGAIFSLGLLLAAGFAARLDSRQVAVALMIGQGALAIGSVLVWTSKWVGGADGGYALIGLFPHKNILAQHMVLLAIASLAVVLSHGYRPILRLVGVGFLLLALFLIANAMSATAVLLLAGTIPLGLGLAFVWRPAVQVRGLRPAIVLGGLVMMTLCLLVLTNFMGLNLVEDVLAAFGKDKSLTGRTVVWAAGNDAIAENPLIGVGAGNFWVADNFAAVRLADQFYNANGEFRFHNSYYEATVHLGVIGLLAAVYLFVRTAALTIGAWWRRQAEADLFFVMIVVVLLIRSFTESELFYPMALGPMLFWTAAFYGLSQKPLSK